MKYILIVLTLLFNQSFGQNKSDDKSFKEKINKEIFDKILDSSYDKVLLFDPWEASATYYSGDLVSFDGQNYKSKINNNLEINPANSLKSEWEKTSEIPVQELVIENLILKSTSFDWWEFNQKLVEKLKKDLDSNQRLKCERLIIFKNCEFTTLVLQGLNFERGLQFDNCKINYLELGNISSGRMHVRDGAFETVVIYRAKIQTCYFRNIDALRSEYNEKPSLSFNKSDLNSLIIEDPPNDMQLFIRECKIVGDSLSREVFFFGKWYASISKGECSLVSRKTTFGNSRDSTVMKIQGNFTKISLDSCIIHSNLNFYSSVITNQFHLTNNTFNKLFSINNSTLPSDIKIRWSQISGQKISKFYKTDFFDPNTGTYRRIEYFTPSKGIGISNPDHFEDIMRSYQVLFNNYKAAGDLESANGCYSEMKDIQTKRLHYLHTQTSTFKSYFRWKLSQLMKFYTDHGTDPARAIVISIWVVIAFGIFYFFFPSDWDVTSKSKLVQNYKVFIEKNEHGYIRPFFVLATGFVLSLINALTLSLNAFTTLGFGNIPTHGLARYICVLEGFIGWFLLSIFTVALINQVLG